MKHVGLDLRLPVFTHGQFYMGISRVTSAVNIKIVWNKEEEGAKTKNVVYSKVLLDRIPQIDIYRMTMHAKGMNITLSII